VRRGTAERAAHRLLLEVDLLREAGVTSRQAIARALTERSVPTPQDGKIWTHTTVGRLPARTDVMRETRGAPVASPVAQAMRSDGVPSAFPPGGHSRGLSVPIGFPPE
jgi:hypothetical protein